MPLSYFILFTKLGYLSALDGSAYEKAGTRKRENVIPLAQHRVHFYGKIIINAGYDIQ